MPHRFRFTLSLTLAIAMLAGLASRSTNARAADPAGDASALARQILDDTRPDSDRKKIIADHSQMSLDLLKALVAGLPPGDSKEEYRRIPWIWRVAVAAGKRNQVDEMKPIVEFCIPGAQEPLRDWQAVVLGGGIINGIGLAGGWPDEQMRSMFGRKRSLRTQWRRVLKLAGEMVDNEKIFKGTRYDALRIVGVDTWDHRGAQLFRYLIKGTDDELQQGAIGGLGNMRSPCVSQALLSGFAHYNRENRGFVLDALLKDSDRTSALLDAVEAGAVKSADLGPTRIETLARSADETIRTRTKKLLVPHQ